MAKKKPAKKAPAKALKAKKPADALTPKQLLFVKEYLVDLNATQAAIRAGYSVKTAKEQASRLLTNVHVSEMVKAALDKRSDDLDLDAQWVLKRLKEISDRCVQAVPVLDASGEPTGEYRFDSSGANKATELIGKHIGMFKEKVELTGPAALVSAEQVRRMAEEVLRGDDL